MGTKLEQLRVKAGYTQSALAKETGVSQKTISAIEKGRIKTPTYKTAYELSKRLNCEPEELLGVGKVDKKQKPKNDRLDALRSKLHLK